MSTDGSALGYAELLKLATSGGLQELDTTVVQIPGDGNDHHAVVIASVRTTRALYRAVGEAWRDTLPLGQRSQTLTVAEFRAKTRALCEAVGMPQPIAPEVIQPAGAAPGAATGSDDAGRAQAGSSTKAAMPAARSQPAEPSPDAPAAAQQPVARLAASIPVDQLLAAPATPVGPAQAPAVDDSQPRTKPTPSRPPARPASVPAEGLGPDVLSRLLQMTHRKAVLEGTELTDDDALHKLDSFFNRAFGHPLAEGTRMEGQRVVQRLASDIARLAAEVEGSASAAG